MATQVEIKGLADFTQATKSLNNFTNSATKGFDSIKTAVAAVGVGLTALGGALAIGKITQSINELIDSFTLAGDSIAKTADRLGIGIEAFQELSFAADRSGVAQSEFDISIQSLTKNIGLAAQGFEKPKQAFDKLGISLRDLSGNIKPTETILNEFSDAIAKVPDQANRAALAQKLFGDSGSKLLNLFKDSSQGVNALRSEFKALGGVVSEDAARASELFRDNLTDLNVLVGSFSKKLASNLLPAFNSVTTVFINFGKQNRELIDKVIGQLSESFISLATTALPLFINGLSSLVVIISEVISLTSGLISQNFSFKASLLELEPVANTINFVLKGIALAASSVVTGLASIAKEILPLVSRLEEFFNYDTNSLIKGIDELKNSINDSLFGAAANDNAKELSDSFRSISKTTGDVSKGVSNFSNNFSELSTQLSGDLSKALNTTNKDLNGLNKNLDDTGKKSKKGKEGLAAFSDELKELKINKVKSDLDQIVKQFENFGLTQVEIFKKDQEKQLKTLKQSLKLKLISEKEYNDLKQKLNLETIKKIDKELKDQQAKELERQQRVAEEFKKSIEVRNNIIKKLASSPINIFFRNNIDEELNKLTPKVRAELEVELKKIEGVTALVGGITTILDGAKGASKILKEGISALGDALLGPGVGEIVATLFEALSKTPEEVKKLIGEFFIAIPTIIQNVLVNVGTLLRAIFENIGPLLDGLLTAIVEGFFSLTDLIVDIPEIILNALLQIDQFIIKLIDAVPLFIDRLINEIPRIIEALVEASPALIVKLNSLMPLVAVKFATSLIANLPTIVFEFAKSFITEGIPAIVKGFIDSFKDAFNGLFDALKQAVPEPIRKVFGFQEGGLVKGFGSKDSIPAMLAPNELVVDRSLTDKLESFLNESSVNQRLASSGQPQNLTINLTVGEEQLASVMVALTQKGFRIA